MDHKKIKYVIDQIEVPEAEVLHAIDRGIKQSKQSEWGRSSQKKKIMISCIMAASVFGLTLSSGFINSNMNKVLADAPVIGGIYERFGDKMGLNLEKQHLVTELDQTITKNGVSVNLNNAYFDGDVVSVTGHVSGDLDKGTNEKGEVSFDVNFEDNKGDSDPWLNGKSTDINNTGNGYDFQWKLAYPYQTMKKDLNLPISIHYINGIKGDWNFNIPITQMKNKTLTINHLKSYQNEDIQIKIDKINWAKASSTMLFETVSNYKGDHIDINKAKDEKGNVLFHYANNTRLSQSKEEDGYHTSLRKSLNKIDKNVKSIAFYPFVSISDPPVQKVITSSSFVLQSKRTKMAIKVNNVSYKNNKLILDYQFLGLPDHMSKNRFDIMIHNLSYEFLLVDKQYAGKINPENPVPPKNHSISRNHVKVLDKKAYQFQSVFQLDGEDKIENFSLQDAVLQFDFSSFIETRELAPFTVHLSK